jgi:hypothetical protein
MVRHTEIPGFADPLPPRRAFTVVGDRYTLTVPELDIQLDLDHVRRERNELWGELSVSCGIAGARTTEGTMSVGAINLSNLRARQERGKYFADRSGAREIDWVGLVEELSITSTGPSGRGNRRSSCAMCHGQPRTIPWPLMAWCSPRRTRPACSGTVGPRRAIPPSTSPAGYRRRESAAA